jgi:hypothetical protein
MIIAGRVPFSSYPSKALQRSQLMVGEYLDKPYSDMLLKAYRHHNALRRNKSSATSPH